MKRSLFIALLVAGCLTASARDHAELHAQATPTQNTPPAGTQKPPAPPPKATQDPNAFPEDTTSVPLMPSKGEPALPPGTYNGEDNASDSRRLPLPAKDGDPIRSPDDAAAESDAREPMEPSSSSSRADMDKLLSGADDDQPQGKHHKQAAKPPEHVETSAEDIEVGKYYLQTKNWKAALSRFESAMVLSPDDPDVYWGLAESERNLGHLAEARGYYQKVAEYDPDSKHGKEAIKLLKDPQIANAKAAPPAPAAASPMQ
ncbi:MAG: tetratricopeptide repeat protein [Terracidiphilus sp.]